MPAQKIGSLLATRELQGLSRKARRLMELQQVFFDSAPRSLARACRIKDYRTGTLFLSAENAAVATKLKQLAPSLLLNIRKREPEVTGIQVSVQVKEVTNEPQSNSEKRPLSTDNIANFRKLSETLPESGLKAALTTLIRRHERQR